MKNGVLLTLKSLEMYQCIQEHLPALFYVQSLQQPKITLL